MKARPGLLGERIGGSRRQNMPEPRQSIGDTSKDVCQARNPTPPAEVEADESSLAVRLMAGGAPDYSHLLPASHTRAIHNDRSRPCLRTTLPILSRDRLFLRRARRSTAAFLTDPQPP